MLILKNLEKIFHGHSKIVRTISNYPGSTIKMPIINQKPIFYDSFEETLNNILSKLDLKF